MLCADFESLIEQGFDDDSIHYRAERKLGNLAEIALPVLRFVCGLGGINHLLVHGRAEFQTNVVGGENFLSHAHSGGMPSSRHTPSDAPSIATRRPSSPFTLRPFFTLR